jgi:hypothetical protein
MMMRRHTCAHAHPKHKIPFTSAPLQLQNTKYLAMGYVERQSQLWLANNAHL